MWGLDGIIYMVPFIADKIGVLNPATQTFSIMDATISGTDKYYGGLEGQWRQFRYLSSIESTEAIIPDLFEII